MGQADRCSHLRQTYEKIAIEETDRRAALKIIVLIKEIIDPETVSCLQKELYGTIKGRYVMNPNDAFALEEALRLKDTYGGQVIVISLGREESEAMVRNALALGADRANLIISNSNDGISVSKILADNIRQEGRYDLILTSLVAVGENRGEIPGRISMLLGIPFVNQVNQIQINSKAITCERETETEIELVELSLPALAAVNARINTPRLPTVMNLLQVNKMSLQKFVLPYSFSANNENSAYQINASNRKRWIIEAPDSKAAVSFLIKAIVSEKVI